MVWKATEIGGYGFRQSGAKYPHSRLARLVGKRLLCRALQGGGTTFARVPVAACEPAAEFTDGNDCKGRQGIVVAGRELGQLSLKQPCRTRVKPVGPRCALAARRGDDRFLVSGFGLACRLRCALGAADAGGGSPKKFGCRLCGLGLRAAPPNSLFQTDTGPRSAVLPIVPLPIGDMPTSVRLANPLVTGQIRSLIAPSARKTPSLISLRAIIGVIAHRWLPGEPGSSRNVACPGSR